jgi:thymidylate synthase
MYTYQRSADMFLGVNFNIPSHATLQIIIAQATGLKPGKLYYGFGDNHVYAEHREALQTLLDRTPNDVFPLLEIARPGRDLPISSDTDAAMRWIEGLTYEDFRLFGYDPQEVIKVAMVI